MVAQPRPQLGPHLATHVGFGLLKQAGDVLCRAVGVGELGPVGHAPDLSRLARRDAAPEARANPADAGHVINPHRR